MNNSIHWYQSKTILATIVGAVLGLLAVFTKVDLRDQADVIVDALLAAGVIISAIQSVRGRLAAQSPIKGTQAEAVHEEVRRAIAVNPEIEAKVNAARRAANPKG